MEKLSRYLDANAKEYYAPIIEKGDVGMNETNAERLRLIDEEKELVLCGLTGALLGIELSNKDYSFLHTEAERAQKFERLIETHAPEGRNYTNAQYVELLQENERLRERSAQLVKDYNELFIQENAMQAHYQLAFKSMQMYKKCCDDITAAMNTERPADEKTKDVRRILEGLK